MRSSLVLVLACALLQACGTVPSMMARPKLQANSVAYEIPEDAPGASIPVARSATLVHNQVKAFQSTWSKKAKELRGELSLADNLQFGSLVWSAYKAATLNLHDAKWGAAVAGGIGLFESKYQIEVQASDYGAAAAAMGCVQSKVDVVSDVVWTKAYDPDTGLPILDSIDVFASQFGVDPDAAQTIADWATYRLIWNKINDRLNAIDARLSDQLDHIRIGMPSSDELMTAFGGGAKTTVGDGSPKKVATFAAYPVTRAMMADLLDLPKKIDGCLAAMGK